MGNNGFIQIDIELYLYIYIYIYILPNKYNLLCARCDEEFVSHSETQLGKSMHLCECRGGLDVVGSFLGLRMKGWIAFSQNASAMTLDKIQI